MNGKEFSASPRITASDKRSTKPPALSKDVAALQRALVREKRVREAKLARMTREEREMHDRKISESIARSKKASDEWAKNPPWFTFYDPYRSVLAADQPRFLDHDGIAIEFRRPAGARHLLYIAKEAAELYLSGNTLTPVEWRDALASWKACVNDVRELIERKQFRFHDPFGNPVEIVAADLDPFDVLSIQQQLFDRSPDAKVAYDYAIQHQLWCVVCMSEVDSALLSAMHDDAGDGIPPALRAKDALQFAGRLRNLMLASEGIRPTAEEKSQDFLVLNVRADFARQGALARLDSDPKQAAKREVKACWDEWQDKPDRYRGKAAFARDMLTKFDELSSQPVIEGWCRTWEAESDKHS